MLATTTRMQAQERVALVSAHATLAQQPLLMVFEHVACVCHCHLVRCIMVTASSNETDRNMVMAQRSTKIDSDRWFFSPAITSASSTIPLKPG